MGVWATWSRWRCPCSLQVGWARWPPKVPSNPNHSMILWFYDSMVLRYGSKISSSWVRTQDFQQPQTHLETHATLFNSCVTQSGSYRNCTHGLLSQRGLRQQSCKQIGKIHSKASVHIEVWRLSRSWCTRALSTNTKSPWAFLVPSKHSICTEVLCCPAAQACHRADYLHGEGKYCCLSNETEL